MIINVVEGFLGVVWAAGAFVLAIEGFKMVVCFLIAIWNRMPTMGKYEFSFWGW